MMGHDDMNYILKCDFVTALDAIASDIYDRDKKILNLKEFAFQIKDAAIETPSGFYRLDNVIEALRGLMTFKFDITYMLYSIIDQVDRWD